ncbi:vacuolar iron transporter Ccc1 [Gaeumannomyces tritici R3-111a-1]|uniref:Vacuolar iron transporter Ccc1 n=1 Tax=Gaeumannomyces tritici (strain R3-111a-1) TaxID=644352 RepID=J3NG16_GAET3|nr:vacuolar iron transporter Ccc1 [Gaeumannomyces tritici R3-111a-1]EJT80206.1 vacuolar iron transporter Ccc1 [Gaeumannomyces tritici R3-111a-1]
MSLVSAKNGLMALLRGSSRGGQKATTTTTAPATITTPSEHAPLLKANVDQNDYGVGGSSSRGSRGDREYDSDDDLESQTSTLASCCSGASSANPRSRVSARFISDATIGLSDGLTVPFALTAGLSALSDTRIVIYGGMAELIAGAISMGLGGYLGAKSEAASYDETLAQTNAMIETDPQGTVDAVRSVFEPYDLPKATLDGLADHITASPDLAGFLMKFQHCEAEHSPSRAFLSGLTIAMGYFLGGLLPLLPYLCVPRDDLAAGFAISVAVMAVALFSFGYAKTCMVSGWRGPRSVRRGLVGGLQMVVVGGAAAASAMLLVKLFNSFVDGDEPGPSSV